MDLVGTSTAAAQAPAPPASRALLVPLTRLRPGALPASTPSQPPLLVWTALRDCLATPPPQALPPAQHHALQGALEACLAPTPVPAPGPVLQGATAVPWAKHHPIVLVHVTRGSPVSLGPPTAPRPGARRAPSPSLPPGPAPSAHLAPTAPPLLQRRQPARAAATPAGSATSVVSRWLCAVDRAAPGTRAPWGQCVPRRWCALPARTPQVVRGLAAPVTPGGTALRLG